MVAVVHIIFVRIRFRGDMSNHTLKFKDTVVPVLDLIM